MGRLKELLEDLELLFPQQSRPVLLRRLVVAGVVASGLYGLTVLLGPGWNAYSQAIGAQLAVPPGAPREPISANSTAREASEREQTLQAPANEVRTVEPSRPPPEAALKEAVPARRAGELTVHSEVHGDGSRSTAAAGDINRGSKAVERSTHSKSRPLPTKTKVTAIVNGNGSQASAAGGDINESSDTYQ